MEVFVFKFIQYYKRNTAIGWLVFEYDSAIRRCISANKPTYASIMELDYLKVLIWPHPPPFVLFFDAILQSVNILLTSPSLELHNYLNFRSN